MNIFDQKSFLKSIKKEINFLPVINTWPADLDTPLSIWLKAGQGRPPGVLLESVEGGENLGRWSVVAWDPLWVVTARGDYVERVWRNGKKEKIQGNPIDILRSFLKPYRSELIPGLPSLGQLYGVWSYELVHWIEPTVKTHSLNEATPPDGTWMFMDSLIIFDQVKRLINAIAYADLTTGLSSNDAFDNAVSRVNQIQHLLSQPLPSSNPLNWMPNPKDLEDVNSNWSQIEFENAVKTAKDYIKKGDIFQLVLSQKLRTKVSHTPFEIYRSLRIVNPSPFMAFFDFGDWQLIGSSPEVMVQAKPINKEIIATLRPIAGTRPRGDDGNHDALLEAELLNDPKERAEHVMLVDLGRNDLGRVCQPGSVKVKDLMVIEKYSHVMHIVSEVEGHLAKDKDVIDLLMASFPAGTVSGAPKIRAMQIINELEFDPRGPYSGVYGSVDLNGALNTAITIRTMITAQISDSCWSVELQAGAGVVADSVPNLEYQETLNKAKGLLTALGCLRD